MYDLKNEDAFLVHTDMGVIKFEASPEGLYQYKILEEYKKELQKEATSHMVTMVAKNWHGYTQRHFERAKTARKLYHNVGTPTVENFKVLL